MAALTTAAILGLIGILAEGTAKGVSAGVQSKELKEAQEEAKALNEQELAEQKRQTRFSENMQEKVFATQQKQVRETANWQKEQAKFDRINGILDRDEQLKSLFINRLSGLRR